MGGCCTKPLWGKRRVVLRPMQPPHPTQPPQPPQPGQASQPAQAPQAVPPTQPPQAAQPAPAQQPAPPQAAQPASPQAAQPPAAQSPQNPQPPQGPQPPQAPAAQPLQPAQPAQATQPARPAQPATSTSSSRYISATEIKILWSLSGGLCAYPGCRALCVAPASPTDAAVPLGEQAHIVAHSNIGPRADPNYPEDKRATYENLILLCPTHHTLVDKQPNTFTVADLRSWKANHEQWIRGKLGVAVSSINFLELEAVCRFLLSPAGSPTANFQVTPPVEKMKRNGISSRMENYLKLGIGGASEVERYVNHMAAIEVDFPERLKAGFLQEYKSRRTSGEQGDVLFTSLVRFSQAGDESLDRLGAGLAVLGYLFMTCEVFEQ